MKAILLSLTLLFAARLAAASTGPATALVHVTATAKSALENVDWGSLVKSSLATHKHNKVVHFPIALGFVGLLFLAFSGKMPSLLSAGRWMVFLAAIGAVAAVLTGRGQAEDVEGELMQQVLKGHSFFGYAGLVGLWLAWLLSFMESAKKWAWAVYLLLAVAVLWTGNLGGMLAHMPL